MLVGSGISGDTDGDDVMMRDWRRGEVDMRQGKKVAAMAFSCYLDILSNSLVLNSQKGKKRGWEEDRKGNMARRTMS